MSRLFPSPPTSWNLALQMMESSLETGHPLLNKLTKDYVFNFLPRTSNVFEGAKFLVQKVKHTLRLAPPPTLTPEALDGATQIGMATSGALFGGGMVLLSNEIASRRNRELQERLAREQMALSREQMALTREEMAQKEALAREQMAQKEAEILSKELADQIHYYNQRINKRIVESKDPGEIEALIQKRQEFISLREDLLKKKLEKFASNSSGVLTGDNNPSINSPFEWNCLTSILGFLVFKLIISDTRAKLAKLCFANL